MNLKEKYKDDIVLIMSKINHNGGELWATKDKKISKGSPFDTRDAALMLCELGFTKKDTIIQEIADLIFSIWKPDGRFKISPSGAIYPCHTIGAARILCYMGYSDDNRIKKTFEHLLETQQLDGGWMCNKFNFGKGPETKYSNPGPTLEALDAFRFTGLTNTDKRLDKAVEFLLWHWEIKKPIGPCHYGIGSLFMKTKFPFFRYNLFYYCYTLSFYKKAQKDKRFKDALILLKKKLKNGKMIIENPNMQLAEMDFTSYMAKLMNKKRPMHIPAFAFKLLLGKDFYEIVRLNCKVSNEKAKRLLEWKPEYPSYKEGLEMTIKEMEEKKNYFD